jgi:diguanylate cyclase (GGDEF)-like protein
VEALLMVGTTATDEALVTESRRTTLARRRGLIGYDVAQAALLFVVAGLVSIVYDLVPGAVDHQSRALIVDSVTVSVGLVIWFLPWQRLPRAAHLALPVLALVQLSVSRTLGVIPDDTYSIWVVLVFVWVGLHQPPKFGVKLAPFAVAACVAPFALGVSASDGAIASLVIAVPVSVMIAEIMAYRAAEVRRAEAERQVALAALARANLTDDLTGLGNRRRANALLDSLADGDALVILDFDHFKLVNDRLGHQHGDRLLQELGAFLTGQLGDAHAAARYGGEEFVLVVRAVEGDPIARVERLLDAWRATSPEATISAGLAVKLAGTSCTEVFSAADRALYEAKQAGRDRAVRFDEPDERGTPSLEAVPSVT